MKRWLVLLIVVVAAATTPARAAGPFGIGIQVGEPTGITAKYFLSGNNALQGAAAWSFSDEGNFHLQIDYLYHFVAIFEGDDKGRPIPWYVGIGGRYKTRDNGDDEIGIRVPLGLAFDFADRFDVFGEVAPVLNLAPSTKVKFNGALGVRIYF